MKSTLLLLVGAISCAGEKATEADQEGTTQINRMQIVAPLGGQGPDGGGAAPGDSGISPSVYIPPIPALTLKPREATGPERDKLTQAKRLRQRTDQITPVAPPVQDPAILARYRVFKDEIQRQAPALQGLSSQERKARLAELKARIVLRGEVLP